MAVPAPVLVPEHAAPSENSPQPSPRIETAEALLELVQRFLHASPAEWLFFRELRAGTGRHNASAQRLDAFALNTLPHLAMKRVCYEVKISRADFRSEIKHPLKRRIGLRYSNEFYFVTPAGLVDHNEVPAECGLVEAGFASPEEWQQIVKRQAGLFGYDPECCGYCQITIPAPWRDTPGPTWQLTAAMLRHQRREFLDRPPTPPQQQKLELT
jgi:hypothetical protein